MRLCRGMRSSRRRVTSAASPSSAVWRARWRTISSGSISMRMILSSSSTPQPISCECRREPMPSTTSACGPQLVSGREGQAELVAGVDHAVPHAIGDDRRSQHLRQRRHLGARVLGATADDDQGTLGLAEHLRRGLDRIVVGHGRRQRRRQAREGRCSWPCPTRRVGIRSPPGAAGPRPSAGTPRRRWPRPGAAR